MQQMQQMWYSNFPTVHTMTMQQKPADSQHPCWLT